MEESQQEPQERGKGSYVQWSPQENKTLINLLLDCVAAGLRDSNGLFSKFTVERRILPTLNQMHGSTKTFQHYSNRMKILKTKYLNAAELLRFSSGFGWDSTTKRFTAPDEVWAEYIKAHPNYKKFRDETFEEFDDLKIIFERNLATGRNAIGLGDTTDARTTGIAETEKERPNYGEEFPFNAPENYESQSSFFGSPSNDTVEKLPVRKRQRTNFLYKADDPSIQKEGVEEASTGINALTTITQKLFNLIEERESRQKQEAEQREAEKKKNNLWEAIKEVSDLEDHVRHDTVKMIHQLGMKDVFISMSIDERYGWIKHNVIGF
ncbi:uncharacterized protein At2g29880-like [Raphanus sativus]|uniref:Uncharacterized protein At2g29880-like n=1 Tax=Raphanus sativus TaxID=3726 RepID=A0A9W3DHS6_RAPSA|nr:uncharacterized protein At2g29880-like [Raphanus sativus]